jgi:hypothetical protein
MNPAFQGSVRVAALLAAPLVALALASAPTGVSAKKSQAQKAYKKGVKAAKKGEYEEAIKSFEEARARGAPPVTLYNIGKCYEALGQFYVAVDYYEEYLEYPKAKKVKKIRRKIDELYLKPSVVTFTTVPPGSEVQKQHDDMTVDKVGVTPLEITLEAGQHIYFLVKSGYKKKKLIIDAGFGKPYELEITMTPDQVAGPVEPTQIGKKKKKRKRGPYDPVGFYMEIGGGAALHPYTYLTYEHDTGTGIEDRKVGTQVGADASFGLGWAFSHTTLSGFMLGLRANFRTYKLEGVDHLSGDSVDSTALFASLLVVPAYKVYLEDFLALEFSLPLGIAWLVPGSDADDDSRINLVDGYISGGNLLLFDLGVGAGLKFWLVRGLYLTIEPVRLHMFFPLTKWKNDAKVLTDLDFGIRLGYEF